MSDPTLDFLSSGGDSAPAASGDATFDFLSSGGESLKEPAKKGYLTADELLHRETARQIVGTGASIAGGFREMYDLIRGRSIAETNKRQKEFVSDTLKSLGLEPGSEVEKQVSGATQTGLASPVNPLNWPGMITDEMARQVTKPSYTEQQLQQQGLDVAPSQVLGPAVAPIISGGLQFASGVAPMVGAMRAPPRPAPSPEASPFEPLQEGPATEPAAVSTAPEKPTSGAPAAPPEIPGKPGVSIDTEPVEGGLPDTAAGPRAEILKRVGLDTARDSAISGDANASATDYQMSKFDEPAGIQAKAQFESERAALQNHAENIVKQTGGTLGMDEDTLHARGQTIAKPFDDLRTWFDQQTKRLYGEAEARSGGAPVTNLESVDALLKSPKFRNSLLAKDQGSLLNAVESQLEEFRKGNPQGFTPSSAEEVRQWLNQIWTNDNAKAVGQLKDAIDTDVLKGAGEDIYRPARAIVQQRKATLDNPKGIASLMDADPQSPVNRVTPHVKVADTLMRLDPAQFENVVKTLREMPEELQPQAQAALSELRAHFANKLLDAGSSTAVQWNAPAVGKVLKTNSSKLQMLFADDPQALQAIQDLDSAGRILRVDTSYPGAAAQAANAMKRGFMSRAVQHVSGKAGAAVGSIFGPLGAAAGAAAGESVGGKLGASMAEKAAVNQWRNKITKLSEVTPP